MKNKSQTCLLLGMLPFLLLLGAFAQSEPATAVRPDAETAAPPAPAAITPSDPAAEAKAALDAGMRSEPVPAVAPAAESVVTSAPEPATPPPPTAASNAETAVKSEPEPVVRLAPVTVTAKTPEQAYLDAVLADPAVPYPLTVSFPKFGDVDYGTNYGRTLELEFDVGTDGVPRNFRMAQPTLEPRLSSQIINALKSWRFSPAHRGDEPVAMRVSIEARIGRPAVVAMK